MPFLVAGLLWWDDLAAYIEVDAQYEETSINAVAWIVLGIAAPICGFLLWRSFRTLGETRANPWPLRSMIGSGIGYCVAVFGSVISQGSARDWWDFVTTLMGLGLLLSGTWLAVRAARRAESRE